MNGSSRSSRPPPQIWQPGQDYWIYLPASFSDFGPARRYLNPRGIARDPWLSFDDRFIGGPSHGFPSLSPPAAPRPSVPLLVYEETTRADSPLPYFEPWNDRASSQEESRLSPEEQQQAVDKLRKQLYSPHINSIIKRLGTKSSTSSGNGGSFQDDVGKRCAVCLEDFETKQFVTITPCNHMFHEECIVPWVKSQGKCPVCRFIIAEKRGSPPLRGTNNIASRRTGVRRNLLF